MMAAYRSDPGGVFDSDTHRRVLAHLPLPADAPTSVVDLAHRIGPDAVHHKISSIEELVDVLKELEADGYAVLGDGWKMTDDGFDALTAPLPEDDDEDEVDG